LLLFGFFRMFELRESLYQASLKKKAEIEAKRTQN
jgi:hypothetical protein